MGLTGNFRFRRGLRGKAVLQVEEEFNPFWSRSGEPMQRWRDATVLDLADPSMRAMLDMGRKHMSRSWFPRGGPMRGNPSSTAEAGAKPLPEETISSASRGPSVRAGENGRQSARSL
jgi:hypothetical protein